MAKITYNFFLENILAFENSRYTPKQVYLGYLETDRWEHLRVDRLELDSHRCRMCNGKATCVHHRCYPCSPKVIGEETLDDLTSLCDDCHNNFHNPPGAKEVKSQFFEILFKGKGTKCPTCERSSKYGVRPLNSTMIRCLLWIINKYEENGREWIHIPTEGPHWLLRSKQHSSLSNWDLLEKKTKVRGENSTGFWKPTELALRFAKNEVKVSKKVVLWNRGKIGESREEVNIQEALASGGFNYTDVVMNPQNDLPSMIPQKVREKTTFRFSNT